MNIHARATLCALLLAGFIHAAQPAAAAPKEYSPRADAASVGAVASGPSLPVIGGGEIVAAQLAQYIEAVQRDEVGRFILAVQEAEAATAAENARLAAEAEAARQRDAIRVAPTPAPSNVTGACGGATNGADQFIQRESGGNPNVYNSGGSGAWGCYQLMPMHFAPGGTCSDMVYGAASPAQQAECASRLPLSAWSLG